MLALILLVGLGVHHSRPEVPKVKEAIGLDISSLENLIRDKIDPLRDDEKSLEVEEILAIEKDLDTYYYWQDSYTGKKSQFKALEGLTEKTQADIDDFVAIHTYCKERYII